MKLFKNLKASAVEAGVGRSHTAWRLGDEQGRLGAGQSQFSLLQTGYDAHTGKVSSF